MADAHPLERVVVFEDRAELTRRINLPGEPGRHHLRVGPLAPTVRAEALAFVAEGVTVEASLIRRERVLQDQADDALARALQAERDALAARLRELEQALAAEAGAAVRARARLEAAQAWSPRALREHEDAAAWVEAVRALAEAASSASSARASLESERKLVQAELGALDTRLRAARAATSLLQSWLELSVLVQRPEASLHLRTVLPCAAWRPVHRAQLDLAGAETGRVRWETSAMVWNATGEPWDDVELVCSTARSAAPAAPPRLTDDRVKAQAKDREIVVQARDEAVQEARVGAARQAGVVPGVADGGEPRSFTARGRQRLPSHGQPTLVPLEDWSADASVGWWAHPERSSAVVRRTRQVNAGARPLLAGPVQLVADGVSVGRGRVGLVAPGEPFALDWGSHDALRLHRVATSQVERGRLTGSQTLARELTLTLHSQAEAGVVVQVVERVPISELKEVSVKLGEHSPALHAGPDADGMVTWRVGVQPGESREIKLSWRVEAPSHVRLPDL